jgi:hypothetical protein
MTITRDDLNISLHDMATRNGDDMPENACDAVQALIDAMDSLSPYQRITCYDMLSDYFCTRCGIEQPPGDCQCGAED